MHAKDAVLTLARPAVSIATEYVNESRIALGGSKFGGQPDLPTGAEWPMCGHGSLGFLGQLDLAELNLMKATQALPKKGLLSCFAFQDANTGYQPGVCEEVPDDMRVLYTSTNESLERRDSPPDIEDHEVKAHAKTQSR